MGDIHKKRHDESGGEILDSVPMQPPLGYKRAPTLTEQIRQQVLAHKLDMLDQMEETEEEADDFEVGEDWEPMSKHENEGAPTIQELKQRAQEINNEIQRRHTEELRAKIQRDIEAKGGRVQPRASAPSQDTEPDEPPIPLR